MKKILEIEKFRFENMNCLSTTHSEISDVELLQIKERWSDFKVMAEWCPDSKSWKVTIPTRI